MEEILFAKKDFQVITGLTFPPLQLKWPKKKPKKLSIRYFVDDILNSPLKGETFEGIFSFNTLHLFSEIDREKIATWITDLLTPKGVFILTSMSTNDGDFGKG
jgi:chemotaxis methyl-accepting protein methylase